MRFYFHQQVGDDFIEDPDGFEFPDVDAARASAVISARHLWAAAIIAGDDLSGESIEVVSADGQHEFSVALSDVLPFRLACAAAELEAAPIFGDPVVESVCAE